MIYDTLSHLQTYRGLSEQMDAALDYIARTDLAALTPGRHDILGDRAYVNRQSPVYRAENLWERHEKYIDIQISLTGDETIRWARADRVTGFSPFENDGSVSAEPAQGLALPLERDTFAVFFPQDAHMPGLGRPGEKGEQVVVKVLL